MNVKETLVKCIQLHFIDEINKIKSKCKQIPSNIESIKRFHKTIMSKIEPDEADLLNFFIECRKKSIKASHLINNRRREVLRHKIKQLNMYEYWYDAFKFIYGDDLTEKTAPEIIRGEITKIEKASPYFLLEIQDINGKFYRINISIGSLKNRMFSLFGENEFRIVQTLKTSNNDILFIGDFNDNSFK